MRGVSQCRPRGCDHRIALVRPVQHEPQHPVTHLAQQTSAVTPLQRLPIIMHTIIPTSSALASNGGHWIGKKAIVVGSGMSGRDLIVQGSTTAELLGLTEILANNQTD